MPRLSTARRACGSIASARRTSRPRCSRICLPISSRLWSPGIRSADSESPRKSRRWCAFCYRTRPRSSPAATISSMGATPPSDDTGTGCARLSSRSDTMDEKFDRDDEDLLKEDVKNRSTGPALSDDDEPRSHGGDSAVDEEPGPYDDDGLPENAKRRVPS